MIYTYKYKSCILKYFISFEIHQIIFNCINYKLYDFLLNNFILCLIRLILFLKAL